RAEPGFDASADLVVERRVADDAALADAPLADLELRLDERDEVGAVRGEREGGGEHGLEADEARVANDDRGRLRNLGGREIARGGPLEDDDPRIVAQPPVELAMADIDSVDA